MKSDTFLQTRGKRDLIKIREKVAARLLTPLFTKASCQRSFIHQAACVWLEFIQCLSFLPAVKLVIY